MQIIPLQAVPKQSVLVVLEDQNCQINVYQTFYGVFFDLYVDGALVLAGAIAQNLNPIVRTGYLGFSGDLAFIDNQGSEDPVYTGLGSRFSLAYLSPADLA